MDSIQKHWKPLALGVAATALAAYLLYNNSKATAVCQDVDSLAANLDASVWPKLRLVIDSSAPLKT